MVPLNALPHTSDYITVDDVEKLGKLIRIITEEMKQRKKLFAEMMVQNIDVYNKTAEEPLKVIVIVVDNYDVVKEVGTEFEDFLVKLSRDGVGLGIYMIVTATRLNGIKYTALNNFKTKIAGYLVDKTEANSLVGRSAYQIPEIEGRVLVKYENSVNLMQIYSMVNFKNEVEYNVGIKELINAIGMMYPTMRAPRIPVLPERFVSSMFGQYKGAEDKKIIVGLHKDTVELRGFDKTAAPFIILGDGGKGKTNLLKVILAQISGAKTFLFDSASKELYYCKSKEHLEYVENIEDAEDFTEECKEILITRKSMFHKALENDARTVPKDFYASLEPMYIVIDDVDELVEKYKEYQKNILECLRLAAETGCGIIATINSTKAKGYDELSKFFKTTTDGILIGNPAGVSIFPTVSSKQIPILGEGLLYHNGTFERLLLPKFVETIEKDGK